MSTQLYQTEQKPIQDADRMRLGAELAKVDLTLQATKDERGRVARSYRVKVRELEEQIGSLSRQLDEGVVDHKFAVIEEPDDAAQKIVIKRADTGHAVSTRPMNEAEKEARNRRVQVELFDADGKPAAAKSKGGKASKSASNGHGKGKSGGKGKG